jgi:hypothetical protein
MLSAMMRFFVEIEDCEEGKTTGLGKVEHHGYVPRDLGIGGGDYVKLSYCLDCGQIQPGKTDFPLPVTGLEEMGDEYAD